MKKQRHQARVVALQGLYQLDIQPLETGRDPVSQVEFALGQSDVAEKAADYARALVAGVWAKRATYDEMLAEAAEHWDVSRMAIVDRNILRMALYELVERPEVPARVVIDEAVELGREFGEADTPHFINGVLDAIWKKHPACRIARGTCG